jgi:hypothetical protein
LKFLLREVAAMEEFAKRGRTDAVRAVGRVRAVFEPV